MKRKFKLVLLILFLLTVAASTVQAAPAVLRWSASSGDVLGYRIYYGLSQGSYPFSEDVGDVTEYALSNFSLTEGTTYYFVIRAYNASGESGNSNVATYSVPEAIDTTPPSSPQGVSAEVVGGDIVLTWNANSESDLSIYRVYYGTSSRTYGLPTSVNGTEHTLSGLNTDVPYYFAVTAMDTSGNESGYSTPEVTKTVAGTDPGPVVSIVIPTTDTTFDTESNMIMISGTAVDEAGVSQVTWANSQGGSGTATGTSSWSISGISLQEGNNQITVSARDTGGNISSDTITVVYTIPDSGPVLSTWIQLSSDNFESGWGSFKDGGSDCRRSRNDRQYAHQGDYCVRLRDNSKKRSSFYYKSRHDIHTPNYTQLKIRFWFLTKDMENQDDFYVEYYDGDRWVTAKRFIFGTHFINNEFYREVINIDESLEFRFPTNMKIRFRCDASNDQDRMYIDQVAVYAR